MKTFSALAALPALAHALALPQTFDPSQLAALSNLPGLPAGALASVGGLLADMLNKGYGKVADPAGAAPRRIEMTPRWSADSPGSKTVKMRYGPYNVPNMMHKNGMGEGGSLWNYPDTKIEKPCDKCVIIGMNAGLEYPSGDDANIDTGAWLHHFVMFNNGVNRSDATCSWNPQSLPHINVGFTSQNSERVFSSGNERTPAFMSKWNGGNKVGYHMKDDDKLAFIVDLMNESAEDKVVYLTITYDYMDGWPAGYDDMRPVWFDAAQCGTSEVEPPVQTGSYTIKAPVWKANIEGEILGAAGHLHDGGQNVKLFSDDVMACDSQATYGGNPKYIAKEAPMDNANSATVHISKMSTCQGENLPVTQMKLGQNWLLTADYNYNKDKGMLKDNGKQDDVMGIAIMYVRQPKGNFPGVMSG